MNKRIAAILAVLVAFAAVVLYGATQANTTASADAPKTGSGEPVKKVTICHFTSIHASHPYNEIEIDAKQIVNGNGHGAHQYDIWGSFKYELKNGTIITVPSHGNQDILKNHCGIPGETPPPTVSPCPTVTVTVTADPGKTHPTPTQCPTVTATATATSTVTSTATATATVTVRPRR